MIMLESDHLLMSHLHIYYDGTGQTVNGAAVLPSHMKNQSHGLNQISLELLHALLQEVFTVFIFFRTRGRFEGIIGKELLQSEIKIRQHWIDLSFMVNGTEEVGSSHLPKKKSHALLNSF